MPPRSPKSKAAPEPYPPGWEPFLDAICDNIDDDTPRLVFADWLQENGDDARAEFIRIQCSQYRRVHPEYENPAVRNKVFTPELRKAYIRQRQLRIDNFDRWISPFPEWSSGSTWAFQRGFAYFFAPTGRQWVKDGPRVRQLTPVELLRITRTDDLARQLFDSPILVGIKRLHLPDIDNDGVRALSKSAALDSLTELDIGKIGRYGFGRSGITSAAATALLRSPRLTKLTSLSLHSNHLGATAATALLKSVCIGNLTQLHLVSTALGGMDFTKLIASPKLKQLRSLNLQGNAVGDDGIRELCHSEIQGLEELNLKYNRLASRSAQRLAVWPGLQSVRVLELAGNPLGIEGCRDLLTSEYLDSMERLELSSLNLTRRDRADLEALPGFKRLKNVSFAS
ncbi:MAG: TIGR02996 domain-containing protein [Planctomycetes bacterium]|nr:TIGR02996 domain-containing protein [Planctomycetota bacterium]